MKYVKGFSDHLKESAVNEAKKNMSRERALRELEKLESFSGEELMIEDRKFNFNMIELISIIRSAVIEKDSYYFDDNDFVKGDKTIISIKNNVTTIGEFIKELRNKGII